LIEAKRKAALEKKQKTIDKAVQDAETSVRNRAFASPEARLVEATEHIRSRGYIDDVVRNAVEVLRWRMIENNQMSDEEVRMCLLLNAIKDYLTGDFPSQITPTDLDGSFKDVVTARGASELNRGEGKAKPTADSRQKPQEKRMVSVVLSLTLLSSHLQH
jgi:hypothetical protein